MGRALPQEGSGCWGARPGKGGGPNLCAQCRVMAFRISLCSLSSGILNSLSSCVVLSVCSIWSVGSRSPVLPGSEALGHRELLSCPAHALSLQVTSRRERVCVVFCFWC